MFWMNMRDWRLLSKTVQPASESRNLKSRMLLLILSMACCVTMGKPPAGELSKIFPWVHIYKIWSPSLRQLIKETRKNMNCKNLRNKKRERSRTSNMWNLILTFIKDIYFKNHNLIKVIFGYKLIYFASVLILRKFTSLIRKASEIHRSEWTF